MPAVTADQIGPKFDILIATRDGSTLPCLDRNKTAQQLSQVAYMHSTNPQKPFREATEIQRKDQLTQLASAQVIDRDFDAWPQVDQKDWSDGSGQRVFSGQGEALGTVANRSTKYWDGFGLLWPLTDYLPQRPFLPPAFADSGSNMINGAGLAAVNTGFFGPPGEGFAFIYYDNANHSHVRFKGGFSNARTLSIDDPPGTSAFSTPTWQGGPPFFQLGGFNFVDWVGGVDAIWYYTFVSGGNLNLYFLFPTTGAGTTLSATLFATVVAGGSAVGGFGPSLLATAFIGTHPYIAVGYAQANVTNLTANFTIKIYQIADQGNLTPTAVTPLLFGAGISIQQLKFLNDNLIISATDGTFSSLIQYNVPSSTFSILAKTSYSSLRIVDIAGGLFVLAANAGAPGQQTIDMYLLQGQNLQYIGPLAQGAFFSGSSTPVAFGPYAVWTAYGGPTGLGSATVYAYDVLRGRLFKLQTITGLDSSIGSVLDGSSMAEVGMMNRSSPAVFSAQWGVVVPTLSSSGAQFNYQEMFFGVQPQGAAQTLRMGCDLTSSLIDFTSSQNKLYRQVVASFTALGTNPAVSVTLNVWTDKDPLDITAQSIAPDFTNSVAGSVANQAVTQLKLPINRVARKLVYEIVVVGGVFTGGIFVNAPKLQSVAVQSATGWSIHFFAVLSKDAVCNDGRTSCFSAQVSGVDELSAYNFLRQLWRLKGGECTITLPSGDSYNALIQLEQGESQKPFGISAQGLQSYQEVYELKFREDV